MITTAVERTEVRPAQDLVRRLTAGAAEAVAGAAADLADDARARVYDLRSPDRPLPSALADSIAHSALGLEAEVRASARHAASVEFGTLRMAARPFLGPAAEMMRGHLAVRLAAQLRRAIRGL